MSHTHKHEKSTRKEGRVVYLTRSGRKVILATVHKKKQTLQKKQNNYNVVFV